MIDASERVRKAIEKSNLSYMELEKLTGVSHSTLQRFAIGKTNRLPLSAVEKLAFVTNTTPAYLMGWEDDNGVLSDDKNKSVFDIPYIIPLPKTKKVPLVGTIACGEPILAAENIEDEIEAPENVRSDFALRCKGDSMINARINDGDIVFIRQQEKVENGEIAAVLLDDEATLKRVYIDNGTITLVAENPKYPPRVFKSEDGVSVRILGKAVAFLSMI